ncbi:FAD-dependent monooxygenase [Streptomyces sp. NPDC059340]|uniref:FAD-dependent monooxygenase n=1 Tax=Streptomyces sp. NPDC059340 TaxID=3346806 RepID=UPI0036B9B691
MTELSATGGRDVHTVRFPAATPPATVDVLVVGAGPVGLAAAVEPTARGVRAAVVDRARTATLVRAGAMGHTPRAVEHLRRWGLLQRVRDAWTYPPQWHRGTRLVTSLAGHELVPVPAPSFTDRATATRHSSGEALRRPQTVFQRVFLDHLREQGVSVSGGWELTELREDEREVDAEVVDVGSGEPRTIRAALRMAEHGAFPEGLGADEELRRFHSFYGHPDEIVAALGQEKVLPVATDLITQFNPAVPDHDAAVRALELIATEVAPALGRQPAHRAEPASAGA